MSFQQGLSGLNAASKSLEVIGNNVSNANTVGFKAAAAEFADVYATSLSGGGASEIGIGTKIADVVQQFSQGNITASDNPLDVAINGSGFFRMDTNGTVTYGRNGQFQLDKSGYIVNAQGANLTGYIADTNGVLSTASPQKLQINTADLAPATTKKVTQSVNLDSTQATPKTTTFSMSDPTSYNNATSVSVYDSLGNSHVLQTYYVDAGNGSWKVYAAADDAPLTGTSSDGYIGTLSFDTSGNLTAPAAPLSAAISASGGAAAFTVQVDYTGTTQYGSAFTVNALSQDGYAAGHLTGFTTGDNGIITGRYSNGKSSTLGQVVLANFTNVNGLQPLGNNVWAETANSGPPLVSTPGSGTFGKLQASAVEDSNVDLTAELVNMITAQRVYQANAQTVKTQDQVMQTLVNLR